MAETTVTVVDRDDLRTWLIQRADDAALRPLQRKAARRILHRKRAFNRLAERLDSHALETRGGKLTAPPGGWLQWLLDNQEKILAFIEMIVKIMKLFT